MENGISYITGDERIIDDIEELWEELNQLHLDKSPYFKHHYSVFTFQARKESLMACANRGKLNVIIACQKDAKIGYCVSSAVDNVGEIDSIYIKLDYRGQRIGDKLMKMSLDWLRENNVKSIHIAVSSGNEEVFGFYSKYGFKPRFTKLEFIPPTRGGQ
jgi:ribosomal protein S18 acetylase RimI-like enzyme